MNDEEVTQDDDDIVEDSLRDTLEEAISASETESEDVHEGAAVNESDAGGVSEPVSATAAAPETADGGEQPAEGKKAPIDWDAGLREQWGTLPPAVQEKVIAREQQVNQIMQEASQSRRMAQDMGQMFSTYGSVLAAEGAQNPMHGVQSLLQTVSELRMGSPAQKATKMAQLISHYGIDISSLDAALVGETPQEPNDPQAIQQMVQQQVNQQLAPFQQQQQFQQERAQLQYQQGAVDEVSKFGAEHEFLKDVRHDMADLIDLATRQGREMPLEEAYEKAVSMNPTIQKVLEGRKLTGQQNQMGQKMAAASSVTGSGQMAASGGSQDMRGMIADAWDAQVG